jgi:hypothetical protein
VHTLVTTAKNSNGRTVIASSECELPRWSRDGTQRAIPGTYFARCKFDPSTRMQRFGILLNTLLHRPFTNLLSRLLDAKGFVAMFIWISML